MSNQVEVHGWSAESEDVLGRTVGHAQLSQLADTSWNLALAPEGEGLRLAGQANEVLQRAGELIQMRRPGTNLKPWRQF
jgi:hypothetical protein